MKKVSIGIDIGGTTAKFGIVSKAGDQSFRARVHHQCIVRYPKRRGREMYLTARAHPPYEQSRLLLVELIAESDDTIRPIHRERTRFPIEAFGWCFPAANLRHTLERQSGPSDLQTTTSPSIDWISFSSLLISVPMSFSSRSGLYS